MKERRVKARKARTRRTIGIALKRIRGIHDWCSGPRYFGVFKRMIDDLQIDLSKKRGK